MQTITSHEFRTNFRENIEFAKYREPITITQYGKPAVVLMSYDEAMALLNIRDKRQRLDERVPNAQTCESLMEARTEFATAKRYSSLDEMMKDIAEFEE